MGITIDSEVVMKPIGEIKPYVRNPRKNAKTVDLLCKMIPKVGFNVPIVIDKDGVIVKGHARFTAAIRLGMKELPCIVTHADPEAIKADRITDNKISEFSEWVHEDLMHELDSLDIDFDLSDLGLETFHIDDVPDFSNFVEQEQGGLDQEQREKLYQEFIQRQEQENASHIQITSEKELEKAKEAQAQTASPPPKYYKVICEKCGHVMFIRDGDSLSYEG